jgi:predicted RNA-binding Zn-ribbon protein involved in translation (DUF1610 family)
MSFSKTINCPQCGVSLNNVIKYTALMKCPQCGSVLVYENESFRSMGKIATLADEPSLLCLNQSFSYQDVKFTPIGKVRYRYDIGFWEEWFVIDSKGKEFWVSVDEGDFAFEVPFDIKKKFPKKSELKVSATIFFEGISWVVSELGEGSCEGFEGQLPEMIRIGEKFDYIHFTSLKGEDFLSVECYKDGTQKAYRGYWVDAYEIKRVS